MISEDYTTQFHARIDDIRLRVRASKLPIDNRISELDEAVSAYVNAQDEHFEELREKVEDEGGQVPVQLRDSRALDACADLLMHEYLTWSHHDKMNIVDNPILSEWQFEHRHGKESTLENVYTGKGDETIGRRRRRDGVRHRIYDYMTPNRDMSLVPTEYLDLYSALDNAGLTERQREAIDLVYFEGLTQSDAGERLGVSQPAIIKFIRSGIRKIGIYLAM